MAKIILDVDINAKNAQAGLKDLEKSINAIAQKVKANKNTNMDSVANSADKLRNRILSLSLSIQSISKNYKKGTFSNIQKELDGFLKQLNSLDAQSKDYVQSIQKISKATTVLEGDLKQTRLEAKNLHGSLQDIVTGFLKFQLSAQLVMVPLQAIQNAWRSLNETLRETEDRILAIRRIVGTSFSSGEMATSLYKIAEQYGQTFENVSEIATNFARSGLSWQETLKATEQAVVALNVAELDATAATDGLLAVMAQFKLSTSDLSSIIDEMSKASDNYLVTTDKILKALQRTGSAASNANLSLEQTIGIITALSKATNRSGENLGTAINSLIQYSSKESALNVFAGLSEDSARVVAEYKKGAATILDVWRQVSVEIKNLKSEQADLLDSYFTTEDGSTLKEMLDGELEDFYTEVGGVYDTANTFRKNYFIALLNNMDTVDEAIGKISDSEGYTQEKNAMYMETYTAKVNALKAQWEEIANDEQGLLGIKKDLVGVASVLLTILKYTGGLKTTLIAVASSVTIIFGPKILLSLKNFIAGLKTAKLAAEGIGTALTNALGIVGLVASAIMGVVSIIRTAKEEAEEAAQEAAQNAISHWERVESKAKEIAKLYTELNELSSTENRTLDQENKYATVQKEIVRLLGDRAVVLSNLSQESDEYVNKLKGLTIEEINRYYNLAEAAALGSNQSNFWEKGGSIYWSQLDLEKEVADYLQSNKFDIGIIGRGFLRLDAQRDFYTRSSDIYSAYEQILNARKLLSSNDNFNKTTSYLNIANEEERLYEMIMERLKNNASFAVWTFIKENGAFPQTKEDMSAIAELTMNASGATEKWRDQISGILKDEYDISSDTKSTYEYTEKIIKNLSQISDKQKSIADAVKKYRDEQQKAEQLSEKQLAIEEAKKKVLEAQQDIVKAYNERNTRVYNAATGEFELQASGKTIQSAEENRKKAEENLQKAIDALGEYVKDQAWDEVVSELETGNATNDSILNIVKKWNEYLGDADFANTIIKTISELAGFDIIRGATAPDEGIKESTDEQPPQQEENIQPEENPYKLPENEQKNLSDSVRKFLQFFEEQSGIDVIDDWSDAPKGVWKSYEDAAKANHANIATYNEFRSRGKAWRNPYTGEKYSNYQEYLDAMYLDSIGWKRLYDDGGVLNGIGGIKATARPETVNDPDLTQKILSPTSNAEFTRYVKDMNLLFGASREYAKSPIISNGNAVTNNNGNTYVVNGMTITEQQARDNTLLEIFNNFPMVG